VINLFDDIPTRTDGEIFTEVLSREDVRIERIVSTGQSTPADQPHRQGHDEWVLLLAGSAGLRIEGEGVRNLRPGVSRRKLDHTKRDQSRSITIRGGEPPRRSPLSLWNAACKSLPGVPFNRACICLLVRKAG
jgi:hypothetical protein